MPLKARRTPQTPWHKEEFSPKTKRAVALRAGYRCSFTDCGQVTIGHEATYTAAVLRRMKRDHEASCDGRTAPNLYTPRRIL
jgi:hypothetical protein